MALEPPQTYEAHDGNTYVWPPPVGWLRAGDGRFYPPDAFPKAPDSTLVTQERPPAEIDERPWWKQTWFMFVAGVVVLTAIVALAAEDDSTPAPRAPRPTAAAAPVINFVEVARNYRGLGCDGTGTSSTLEMTVRGGGPQDCVDGAIVAFDVFGIPRPVADPTDLTAVLGTYQGDDYQATVAWAPDLDGVTFTFTRR